MLEPTTVLEFLSQLNSENAEHWTSLGEVKMDVFNTLTGMEMTRQQLNEAIPGLKRSTLVDLLAQAQAVATTSVDEGDGAPAVTVVVSEPPATTAEVSTQTEPTDVEQMVDHEAAIRRAKQRWSQARAALQDAERAVDEAKKDYDRAQQAAIKVKPQKSQSQEYKEHLARQRASREPGYVSPLDQAARAKAGGKPFAFTGNK